MRILYLDIPTPGATLGHYAPHLTAETLHTWGLYKSSFIRGIYSRQDRLGATISLECSTVGEANNITAEFPLAKVDLSTLGCILLGSFISWENLFSAEFKRQE